LKNRLRYTLTATFTIIAIVPILFLGLWVERTSYLRELSSVEEKHLLLAKKISPTRLSSTPMTRRRCSGFWSNAARRSFGPRALRNSPNLLIFAISRY